MGDFTPNGTVGRLHIMPGTCERPKMLTKPPGVCEAWLESVWKEHGFGLTDELQRDVNFATSFRKQCRYLPEKISEQALNELRQTLNDYVDNNMPLEDIYRLRYLHNLYEDVYRPGPRLESLVTEAEQKWEREFFLKHGNDLVFALLGAFSGPGRFARALGLSEQQVANVNNAAAEVVNMTATHVSVNEGKMIGAAQETVRDGVRVEQHPLIRRDVIAGKAKCRGNSLWRHTWDRHPGLAKDRYN